LLNLILPPPSSSLDQLPTSTCFAQRPKGTDGTMAAPQTAVTFNDVFEEGDADEPKESTTIHHIRANSSIMQVKKILVANRGEIPIRIFRTAHELSLHTIAVFSYEDRLSMHRQSMWSADVCTIIIH
jgi:hypothetical protein